MRRRLLAPVQARFAELMNECAYLESVMKTGRRQKHHTQLLVHPSKVKPRLLYYTLINIKIFMKFKEMEKPT